MNSANEKTKNNSAMGIAEIHEALNYLRKDSNLENKTSEFEDEPWFHTASPAVHISGTTPERALHGTMQ
jgi:hypothetical protein